MSSSDDDNNGSSNDKSDDSSDSSNDNGHDSDGSTVNDNARVTVGSKHHLEDIGKENIPKIIKDLNGACQCLKAGDFDDVTKHVLTIATSIYHCLIVTRTPFPKLLIIKTKVAKHVWRDASHATGLTVQLMSSLVKMVSQ